MIEGIDENSTLPNRIRWGILINIHQNHNIFHHLNLWHCLSWWRVWSIYEGLERVEFGDVQVYLIPMIACWDSKIIKHRIGSCLAVLSFKHRRHGDKLLNRAIMSHTDHSLRLLDETSMNGEHIVRHVNTSDKISFILKMIDHIDFVTTFITPL